MGDAYATDPRRGIVRWRFGRTIDPFLGERAPVAIAQTGL